MSFSRLSGFALAMGGVIGFTAIVLHPQNPVDPANLPVHLALYTAVMVILLGLPGFGARLAASAGALGLGAMVVLFLGTAFGDPIHSVLFFTVVPALTASPTGRELFAGPPPGLMDPVQMAGYFTILAGPLRQPRSFPQIAAALAGWSAMAYGLTRRPTSASAGGFAPVSRGTDKPTKPR